MFAKKVVIVTGGSSGIGSATAEYFAREGASVTIVGRNEEKLKNIAQRCERFGAKVHVIKADISKEEEAKTIVKQTVDKFGKLDVLVNNAGIVRITKIDDVNVLEVCDEVLNTNLRSVVQVTNLAVPHLKETKGNIVNVSSTMGQRVTVPGFGAYAVSKAGLDHFTRSSAVELAPAGVRVNAVSPGPVKTDIFQTFTMPKEVDRTSTSEVMTPMGRIAESEEIADLILYLASDRARSVTGSCYVIDNGVMLS